MNINISIPKISQSVYPSFRAKQEKGAVIPAQSKDTFEMSIGYINDLHGQTNNMTRILSGLKGDLKLSGGDNTIGDEGNKQVNRAVVKFLNRAGIKVTALGNHELDTTQKDFADTARDFDGKVLAANYIQQPVREQASENIEKYKRHELNNVINKSEIVEVKGQKIGIVGAAPVDLGDRLTHPEYHDDVSVYEMEKTIGFIQKEVDELKKQGINKIVLVSHLGHKRDRVVAQNTNGIDVIVGGHTHELVEGIKEGKNLLYSESDEPVILTEAGRDGKNFGLLNLTFDKNGVITKAQNNIANTGLYPKNMINEYIFNQYLGKPEQVGYIKSAPMPPKTLIEENPHANFMCDAMRIELGTDIAFWNNTGARNFFHVGPLDTRDVKDIAPFNDHISVADVSEKKFVDMLKRSVEDTFRNPGHKPGLLAVSGMNYTVNRKTGKLAGMNVIDKNGKEIPVDINNPREDKTYKVVSDSYMMTWTADYDVLAKEGEAKVYDFNKDFLTCEYIKHLNRPIEINQTGRIRFIEG